MIKEVGDAKSSASLYASVDLNLRDRVFGEVEKCSFIALPDKGGHSGLMPSKPCVQTCGKIVSFVVIVQRGSVCGHSSDGLVVR